MVDNDFLISLYIIGQVKHDGMFHPKRVDYYVRQIGISGGTSGLCRISENAVAMIFRNLFHSSPSLPTILAPL